MLNKRLKILLNPIQLAWGALHSIFTINFYISLYQGILYIFFLAITTSQCVFQIGPIKEEQGKSGVEYSIVTEG